MGFLSTMKGESQIWSLQHFLSQGASLGALVTKTHLNQGLIFGFELFHGEYEYVVESA
jgi:hypothetical protein